MQSMQVSLLGQRTGLERIEDGSVGKNWKDPLLPTIAYLTIFEALEPFRYENLICVEYIILNSFFQIPYLFIFFPMGKSTLNSDNATGLVKSRNFRSAGQDTRRVHFR